MPHATNGGVTDVNVDPDYTAPPGVPPEHGIAQGIPDAAQAQEQAQQEENPDGRRDEPAEQPGGDGQPAEADRNRDGDVPDKSDKPAAKRAGSSTKRTSTR